MRSGITFSLDEREETAFAVELESHLEDQELIDLIRTLPPPFDSYAGGCHVSAGSMRSRCSGPL